MAFRSAELALMHMNVKEGVVIGVAKWWCSFDLSFGKETTI